MFGVGTNVKKEAVILMFGPATFGFPSTQGMCTFNWSLGNYSLFLCLFSIATSNPLNGIYPALLLVKFPEINGIVY